MSDAELLENLRQVVSPERVVMDPARLAEYRGIAWGAAVSKLDLRWPLGPPAVAVLPTSTPEVVAVVDAARRAKRPIVPYGAGTGVHAGAAPLWGAIVLDMGHMDRVLSISAGDRKACVEPGVLLGILDRDAAEHGLMVGHDPWSQPIASVGGAVSTNGVGYLAGKYGSMGEQVLGLEVVLGTGEVIRTPSVPKASTGPQLRHLFVGAEGVLGIITRIDVRLFPIPEKRALAGYWFPRFEDGLEAVIEMLARQMRPSMIDYEEDSPERLSLGDLPDTPSEMYLAFEGFEEEVEAQVRRADAICRENRATSMAKSEVQTFWDTRHQSAERYLAQRQAGQPRHWRSTTSHLNIGLPVTTISEFRARSAREIAPYRLALSGSGLWGMPELFSVRFEHQQPDDASAEEELDEGTDVGLRIALELGGSMEYCHGVGLRLAHLMQHEWGSGFDALRRIKQALDPDGILNPGKLGL